MATSVEHLGEQAAAWAARYTALSRPDIWRLVCWAETEAKLHNKPPAWLFGHYPGGIPRCTVHSASSPDWASRIWTSSKQAERVPAEQGRAYLIGRSQPKIGAARFWYIVPPAVLGADYVQLMLEADREAL